MSRDERNVFVACRGSFAHLILFGFATAFASASLAQESSVRMPLNGHVLPILSKAVRAASPDISAATQPADQPITLTVVLRRSDPDGFARYLADVYDQNSPQFRSFLTPAQVTERFGPSKADYDAVVQYFTQRGFAVGEASVNRMTVMLNGTRGGAEQALAVSIEDFRIGERAFFANTAEPTLPADLAAHVEAIVGLANLAQPATNPQAMLNWLPNNNVGKYTWYALCANLALRGGYSAGTGTLAIFEKVAFASVGILNIVSSLYEIAQFSDLSSGGTFGKYMRCNNNWKTKSGAGVFTPVLDPPPPAWQGADGTGQTVGLLQFDTFLMSDVTDYVNLMGQASGPASNVSQVHVNGGATLGPNQTEVLIDIAAVLTTAPGAKIKVFDAPFTGAGTSFQGLFNAMIGGGVDIIGNSWAYCEDQTTLADVQSIDTILQTAAASGISVFNASGDSGSTCLDGSPNTAGVPATSPHATAVGGTSLQNWPGFTYGSETWWDGSTGTPPSGQGGFGASRFFSRPSYQNGATTSATRSIPDVSANADPVNGVMICQASAGGCPTGNLYGGTSSAAPTWAGFAALLNQTQGSNLGFLNPLVYPLANTGAFHNAASMGSNFAHVGLGSPNLARMHQALTGILTGPVSTAVSTAFAYAQTTLNLTQGATAPSPSFADGTTQTFVVVTLNDANGIPIGGKNITLTGNPGNHAVFTPPNALTGADSGVVLFAVTDSTVETVTLTATDTTDGVALTTHPKIQFFSPPAAAGNIVAGPTSVPAGFNTSIITVTLQDATGAGAQSKRIAISQGSGHSIVTGMGLTPGVTDVNGVAQFNVFDEIIETVVYSAVDVTDANLAVPGTATIAFTDPGAPTASCVGPTPVGAPGYTLTPFITGFFSQDFTFGNVNWGGCPGATNPTFTTTASVFGADFRTGNLYRLGLAGGTVTDTNKLSSLGLTLGQPVFGKDGRLYATHGSTGGFGASGDIVEIDPVTGAQIRVVAASLACPNGLSVDPLSGDLFFDDACTGGGFDDPSIYRIHDPANTAVKSTYATLPGTPNGFLAFSPDGTLYAVTTYTPNPPPPPVIRITGTDKPQPATTSVVAGLTSSFYITVGEVNPDGSAKSLIVPNAASVVELVDITTVPFTHTPLITGGAVGSGVIGPDGCLYAASSDTIYKLTDSGGGCSFVPTNPAPALQLAPALVAPSPAQGGTQILTATFSNVSVPAGTPVTFRIDGANAQVRLADTDASGMATVSYVGAIAGTDTVIATGAAGAMTLTSNPASVTWVAGKHLSALGPVSPNASVACMPATLSASLTDASANPLVAIPGATVHFTLGSQSCNAVTNGNGVAACTVRPSAGGQLTMTASFAGNAGFTAATLAQTYSVPAISGGGATPTCVVSRKVHATAGPFDLPLSNVPTNPTTEPRLGPAQTLVFAFDSPVSAGGTAAITEGVAIAGTPTFSGNEVTVDLSGVSDQQYVTVTLNNVVTGATASGGGSVRVGFLAGDVNASRLVAVTDLVVVNNQLGRALTTSNFLSDVNLSGIITVLDKVKVNNALGHFLPAP